jgi:hypothetical protein
MLKVRRFATVLAVLAMACGPTIGDPCTSANDCLNRTCITGSSWPGGYCSQSCALDNVNSCPQGSVCVPNGISAGLHGCYHACTALKDCRATYTCRKVMGSDQTVCVQ